VQARPIVRLLNEKPRCSTKRHEDQHQAGAGTRCGG
jgi:hypothetical protein